MDNKSNLCSHMDNKSNSILFMQMEPVYEQPLKQTLYHFSKMAQDDFPTHFYNVDDDGEDVNFDVAQMCDSEPECEQENEDYYQDDHDDHYNENVGEQYDSDQNEDGPDDGHLGNGPDDSHLGNDANLRQMSHMQGISFSQLTRSFINLGVNGGQEQHRPEGHSAAESYDEAPKPEISQPRLRIRRNSVDASNLLPNRCLAPTEAWERGNSPARSSTDTLRATLQPHLARRSSVDYACENDSVENIYVTNSTMTSQSRHYGSEQTVMIEQKNLASSATKSAAVFSNTSKEVLPVPKDKPGTPQLRRRRHSIDAGNINLDSTNLCKINPRQAATKKLGNRRENIQKNIYPGSPPPSRKFARQTRSSVGCQGQHTKGHTCCSNCCICTCNKTANISPYAQPLQRPRSGRRPNSANTNQRNDNILSTNKQKLIRPKSSRRNLRSISSQNMQGVSSSSIYKLDTNETATNRSHNRSPRGQGHDYDQCQGCHEHNQGYAKGQGHYEGHRLQGQYEGQDHHNSHGQAHQGHGNQIQTNQRRMAFRSMGKSHSLDQGARGVPRIHKAKSLDFGHDYDPILETERENCPPRIDLSEEEDDYRSANVLRSPSVIIRNNQAYVPVAIKTFDVSDIFGVNSQTHSNIGLSQSQPTRKITKSFVNTNHSLRGSSGEGHMTRSFVGLRQGQDESGLTRSFVTTGGRDMVMGNPGFQMTAGRDMVMGGGLTRSFVNSGDESRYAPPHHRKNDIRPASSRSVNNRQRGAIARQQTISRDSSPEEDIQRNRHSPVEEIHKNRHSPDREIHRNRHASDDESHRNRHSPVEEIHKYRHFSDEESHRNRHSTEEEIHRNRRVDSRGNSPERQTKQISREKQHSSNVSQKRRTIPVKQESVSSLDEEHNIAKHMASVATNSGPEDDYEGHGQVHGQGQGHGQGHGRMKRSIPVIIISDESGSEIEEFRPDPPYYYVDTQDLWSNPPGSRSGSIYYGNERQPNDPGNHNVGHETLEVEVQNWSGTQPKSINRKVRTTNTTDKERCEWSQSRSKLQGQGSRTNVNVKSPYAQSYDSRLMSTPKKQVRPKSGRPAKVGERSGSQKSKSGLRQPSHSSLGGTLVCASAQSIVFLEDTEKARTASLPKRAASPKLRHYHRPSSAKQVLRPKSPSVRVRSKGMSRSGSFRKKGQKKTTNVKVVAMVIPKIIITHVSGDETDTEYLYKSCDTGDIEHTFAHAQTKDHLGVPDLDFPGGDYDDDEEYYSDEYESEDDYYEDDYMEGDDEDEEGDYRG